ncbi:hypothetical protein [Nonomuraea sp. LPB2021202275-12-8]|uniref:hypothetical protein n=1 Tax=Nonomuraea sp. LPB2021202275-12-8 TaxID=3120159 RepID=UPI00300D8662
MALRILPARSRPRWCSRGWQSGWLDFVEEGEGFGGVRAHEAVQTGRRDLRPPAGPCPHLFLEGADGLIQIAGAGAGGGGDGLGEFGAVLDAVATKLARPPV